MLHVSQYSVERCNYVTEGSLYLCSYSKLAFWDTPVNVLYLNIFTQRTVELRLSELISTKRHPDVLKIQAVGFLFENRVHWQFAVRLLLFIECTCV